MCAGEGKTMQEPLSRATRETTKSGTKQGRCYEPIPEASVFGVLSECEHLQDSGFSQNIQQQAVVTC